MCWWFWGAERCTYVAGVGMSMSAEAAGVFTRTSKSALALRLACVPPFQVCLQFLHGVGCRAEVSRQRAC